VDSEHPLFKHGFIKMEELSKPQQATILVKILQKCLVSSLKMKKNKKRWSGKQVGDLQPDPLVSW